MKREAAATNSRTLSLLLKACNLAELTCNLGTTATLSLVACLEESSHKSRSQVTKAVSATLLELSIGISGLVQGVSDEVISIIRLSRMAVEIYEGCQTDELEHRARTLPVQVVKLPTPSYTTTKVQFSIGPPGPEQWMFILNEQPLFRLNLFSVQRPLSSCCTDLQLRCNVQEPGRPKPAVLPCITVHVKVCSMVSNCVILDIVKGSKHKIATVSINTSLFVDAEMAIPRGVYILYETGAHKLWTAVMVGTKLGLLHLDDVLKGVMRTLAPSICTYQPASAVEPVLACFQERARTRRALQKRSQAAKQLGADKLAVVQQCTQLRATLYEAQAATSDAFERTEVVTSQLIAMKQEKDAAQAEAAAAKAEAAAARAELAAALRQAGTQSTNLQSLADAASHENERLTRELTRLRDQQHTFGQQASEMQTCLNQAQADLVSTQQEKTVLKERMDSLTRQLQHAQRFKPATSTTSVHTTSSWSQESKGREEQVLQQLPDKEAALAGSENLRKQLTNQVALLQKDLSAAKDQAEEEKAVLQEQMDSLTRQLQHAQRLKPAPTTTSVHPTSSRSQGSKGREEQVLQQLPDKEVALAGSEKLRKQLTNQVTLLQKDLSAAKCQAEEVLKRHSAQTRELRQRLAHSQTEIKDLQLSSAALKHSCTQAQQKAEEREGVLLGSKAELQDQLEALQRQLQDYEKASKPKRPEPDSSPDRQDSMISLPGSPGTPACPTHHFFDSSQRQAPSSQQHAPSLEVSPTPSAAQLSSGDQQDLLARLSQLQQQWQVTLFAWGPFDTLGDLIAEGGNGAVMHFDSPMFPSTVVKAHKQRCLAAEAEMLAICRHPSVVRVYALLRPQDAAAAVDPEEEGFMIMEELGQPLRDLTPTTNYLSTMPLEEVVCLAYSVAAALQWTHSKQVVHQDVHAGNILQTLDGYEWRLADFGNAAWMYAADGSQTRLTSSWCPRGSEAPEMAEDLERLGYYHPTPANDMWAFGLVLMDLAGGSRSTAHLTACVTKDPEKTRAFARSLLCRAPRLEYYDQVYLPELPEQSVTVGPFGEASLEGVIVGCLTLDPTQRFSACQAAQHLYLLKQQNGW